MFRATVIVLWLAALATAAGVSLAGSGSGVDPVVTPSDGRRRRPDQAPAGTDDAAPLSLAVFADYATPPRTYAGRDVVVHYVTAGRSAPPLNDDDTDGVPDYVERVAEAADAAVAEYARRGFARIRPDTGGPDARSDVYVSRFAAGTFGVAIPEADAVGGAFAVVANSLDPSRDDALGSLDGTVAHEVFHLVQFAYFGGRDVDLPAWVLEGSAAAMERRLHPEIADVVSTLQLRRWFAAPHRSLTKQSYGAQLLWAYVDRRHPRLLPAYLARLATGRVRGEGAAELAATFRRVTGRPLAPLFHAFALAVAAEYGTALTPARRVGAGVQREAVPPLAIHYVRLGLRRGDGAVSVRVRGTPQATLVYELESETAGEPSQIVRAPRRVHVNGDVVFRIPAGALRARQFARPLLVVSNGGAAPARYRLSVS
jgi:hypothetical protein